MKKQRGALSDSTYGSKPGVAYESERLARENIEAKLGLIATSLKTEGARRENLPASVRQFNLWSPTLDSGAELKRNSNVTLARHKDLRLSVEQAVSAVKVIGQQPSNANSRVERLASARRSLQMHKNIRQIAERELTRARMEIHSLIGQLELKNAQLASVQTEARAMLDVAQQENAHLKLENARLTMTLAKVAPIKKV